MEDLGINTWIKFKISISRQVWHHFFQDKIMVGDNFLYFPVDFLSL